MLISESVDLNLCLCEDFEDCLEDVLEDGFDDDLAETFEDNLDVSFVDDLDKCLEVFECTFAELQASDARSGRDWDVLYAFSQHSTGDNKTCRLKRP